MSVGTKSQQGFFGGRAEDDYMGPQNSFAFSSALDVRRRPSAMSVLPQPDFLNIVDDDGEPLEYWHRLFRVQERDVAMGRFGFYQIEVVTPDPTSGSGITANIEAITTAFNPDPTVDGDYYEDAVYSRQLDQIIAVCKRGSQPSGAQIAIVPHASKAIPTAPASIMQVDMPIELLSPLVTNTLTTDSSDNWMGTGILRSSGTANYNIPTTIIEDATNTCVYLPNQPYTIRLDFMQNPATTTPADTIKLTVHDPQNVTMAEVMNSDAPAGIVRFYLPRDAVNRSGRGLLSEYHFHLTSDTGGSVYVVTANDFSTANFKAYASLYQGNDIPAQMTLFLRDLFITNGGWITQVKLQTGMWSDGNIILGALALKDGDIATTIYSTDEYVICGARTAEGLGRLYFWDTYTDSMNFFVDCSGEPESIMNYRNTTYVLIRGSLFAWSGGKQLEKVATLIDGDTEYSVLEDSWEQPAEERMSGNRYMTIRNDILLINALGNKLNPDRAANQGIYGFGARSFAMPYSLTLNYPFRSNVRATDILNVGGNLYTNMWGEQIGLTVLTPYSVAASEATWESLVFTADKEWTEKLINRIVVKMDGLTPGWKGVVKIKIDDKPWEESDAYDLGETNKIYLDTNTRYDKVQHGFRIWRDDQAQYGVVPIIRAVAFSTDTLDEEKHI